jgi:putative hemolysin
VQIGITLIGILLVFIVDKITTDVQTFVAGFAILKPYATIAVGVVVVVLTFFIGVRVTT